MSERKGVYVRMDEETKERMRIRAEANDVSLAAYIRELILIDLKGDKPKGCIALSFIEGKYKCIWGRPNNVPNIKILAREEDEKDDACSSCMDTLKLIEENISLRDEISRPKVIQFPICRRGAKVNEALDKMFCPEIGRWRPIKVRQKKTDPQPCHARGEEPYHRCQHIEWTQITVKGELEEKDNR